MLRDITLGQYYQTDSVIHRLDPRVKLVATLIFIISLFLVDNFIGYLIAAAFLACMVKISRVPFRFMIKGMKSIVFLLLIAVIFNLFLTPGEPLISFWKLTVTKEGLRMASMMAVRLVFLIIGSSLMTLTTTPNNLTDGMEKLMSPLKRLHVPVHEVASLVPLLVPLFISAFRRANDLAMAMEARCYRGGEHRTKMKPLIYHKRDRLAYAILFVYAVVCVYFGRFFTI